MYSRRVTARGVGQIPKASCGSRSVMHEALHSWEKEGLSLMPHVLLCSYPAAKAPPKSRPSEGTLQMGYPA